MTKELANTIIEAIKERKGKQIVSLELTKLDQSICDYFIICHADSNTQVNAIADFIQRKTKEDHKEAPLRVEGKDNSTWVLIDYGDVVIQIFQEEFRKFYNLEELWADAKIETIEDEN